MLTLEEILAKYRSHPEFLGLDLREANQRGAVDGLNVVVPYAEQAYYTARPTIAIPREAVIDLDEGLDHLSDRHWTGCGL